jgi:rhodanese-related sulfurtransferase
MIRKTYAELAAEAAALIPELAPWDLDRLMRERGDVLLVDVREPAEFAAYRIGGSINVPRGILEAACEWDYPETVPELVQARARPVVVICRSGLRSAFAALTMRAMGYENVSSMKLGLRGWNDGDLPLIGEGGEGIDGDTAAGRIDPALRSDQRNPASRRA